MNTSRVWPSQARVYAVDDDDSFRQSLLRVLDVAGLKGIGYASAGDFLIDRMRECEQEGPACMLLDISMPGPSGIELMKALASHATAPPIVFLTARDDVYTSVDVMKCGAVDYLVKPVKTERLLQSIERALLVDVERRTLRSERGNLVQRMSQLTNQERFSFRGVVTHRLNKQMAVQLNVCERTVKTLRSRMMEKLQMHSVPELVRAALLLQADAADTSSAKLDLTHRQPRFSTERADMRSAP